MAASKRPSVAVLRKRLAAMKGAPCTMYSGEVVRPLSLQPSKAGGRIYITGTGVGSTRMISITCLVNLMPDSFFPECVEKMRANGQTSWDGK